MCYKIDSRLLLKKSLKIGNVWFLGASMFLFLTFVFRLIFSLGISRKELLARVCIQQKEIEILTRQHPGREVRFLHSDRIIVSLGWFISSVNLPLDNIHSLIQNNIALMLLFWIIIFNEFQQNIHYLLYTNEKKNSADGLYPPTGWINSIQE